MGFCVMVLRVTAATSSSRNCSSFGDSCYAKFVGTGSACLKSGNLASQRRGFWSTVATPSAWHWKRLSEK